MRHRWTILALAAYLAAGVALAVLPGCGMAALPPSPPAPEQPVAPPPGQETGVEGITTDMSRADVDALLGQPSVDPEDKPGEPDLVGYRVVHEGQPGTWFVGYVNGRVAFVRFARIGEAR